MADAGRPSVGRYRIERTLEVTDEYAVYQAVDASQPSACRRVTLRAMRPHHRGDARRRATFARAAMTHALSAGSVFPRFHECFDAQGVLVMVFERFEGVALPELVPAFAAATLEERERAVAYLGGRLFGALAEIHSRIDNLGRPSIHGRLRPRGVLVAPSGDVKLVELGTAEEPARGFSGYEAPEMAHGGRADPRSDVYAGALILFELLTGARRAPSALGISARPDLAIAHSSHYLSPSLREIVVQCLSPDPAERESSADHIARALESLAGADGRTCLGGLCAALSSAPRTNGSDVPTRPAEFAPVGLMGRVLASGDEAISREYADEVAAFLEEATQAEGDTLRPPSMPRTEEVPPRGYPFESESDGWPKLDGKSNVELEAYGRTVLTGATHGPVRSMATSSTLTIGTGFVLAFVLAAAIGARFDARPHALTMAATANLPDKTPTVGSARRGLEDVPAPIATSAPVGLAATRSPVSPVETGVVDARAEAVGHRLFVDGRVVGQTPCEANVRCGSHVVQVGSGGLPRRVVVPCGGVIRASPEKT